VKVLSGGEKQRIIAKLSAHGRTMMLLDEPTTHPTWNRSSR
jgi:ATPase subunit of ABC transporter with duplicated ATPase domains